MIIYQNGLLNLDYNPGTDVLIAELPNVVEFGVPELSRVLTLVAEHTCNYDIKLLLLDSSNVLVDQLEDGAYKAVVGEFLAKLTRSRLKRLARVNSAVASHEERVLTVTSEATQRLGAPFRIMTFSGRDEALAWLLK
ncbi:hypothetical protein [Pontibacter rugosus]|uniref:SpoIIAA-like protein n=1 Tax=Pontibacter rugosus TaxID=1745966 RepID=A0ABW3SMU9_9BACT